MRTNDFYPAAIALPRDAVHRLENGRGQRIEAIAGSLWITIDGDLRDVLVEAGEGFSLKEDGVALISALTDARFLVLETPVGALHRDM